MSNYKYKKDGIYVRTKTNADEHGKYGTVEGDIVKCLKDAETSCRYADGRANYNFRKASLAEEELYALGQRNVYTFAKGKYYVRTQSHVSTSIHGQKEGDIIKCLKSHNKYCYYFESRRSQFFREATANEISAYMNGGNLNVAHLTPEKKTSDNPLFKKGDYVRIIKSGCGHNASDMGKIVMITSATKLGYKRNAPKRPDQHGYTIFPAIGNGVSSPYGGMNGEESYQLYNHNKKAVGFAYMNGRSKENCAKYKELCEKYNVPYNPKWTGIQEYVGINRSGECTSFAGYPNKKLIKIFASRATLEDFFKSISNNPIKTKENGNDLSATQKLDSRTERTSSVCKGRTQKPLIIQQQYRGDAIRVRRSKGTVRGAEGAAFHISRGS